LDAVLHGSRLDARDRKFVRRLVHWDKRNAAAVVSLLCRVRLAGRAEGTRSRRERELIAAALGDAALYRMSGISSLGCWDCENTPTGRCAEHMKDAERAHAYAELAAQMSAADEEGSGVLAARQDWATVAF
jgi:hypothetical protein